MNRQNLFSYIIRVIVTSDHTLYFLGNGTKIAQYQKNKRRKNDLNDYQKMLLSELFFSYVYM